ncbi:MAG: cell division protein FtsW [Oscillospiraceae bacterium]|nr:cell division protein FtsW [Oscillospiraceae bacterium]
MERSRPKKKGAAEARKTLNFRIIGTPQDKPFFFIVIILLVFGTFMMFSASYIWGLTEFNNGYYFLQRQLVALFGGLAAMIAVSFLDYHFFQNTRIAYLAFIVVFGLTLVTSFIGTSVAGARRWIVIGPINFQPSELLKVAFIILMAYLGALNYPKFKHFGFSTLPFLMVMGLCCGVLVLQRHLSGVLIFGAIGVAMIFVAGVPLRHFAVLVGAVGVLGGLFLTYKIISGGGFGYITERIQSWQDPTSDILGSTLQTYQSMLAIGSGGIFGLGFGESRQKHLWLPEAQNDFVFAIVCEEFGFLGAIVVILLFALFVFRGFYIAANAPDRFGMLLAAGITIQIGIQAFLNIGVACNAFPNTGISLPFFSYGGTALLIQLAEMGILLNISRQSNIKE